MYMICEKCMERGDEYYAFKTKKGNIKECLRYNVVYIVHIDSILVSLKISSLKSKNISI